MNPHYPQFPRLTSLTRITGNGDESILSNLANGRWIRINNKVLSCLRAQNLQSITLKLLELADSEEVEALLSVLKEYDFIDFDEGKIYPENFSLSPHSAYLNVTNNCNLRCKHCYFDSSPGLSQGVSNFKLFSIIDSLKHAGIANIVIAGGEPLTRKGITEVLEYIRDKKFQEVTLLTNGTIYADHIVASVARCVSKIHVSLDGPDDASNAVLRGKGNFESVLIGISKFKEAGIDKVKLITSITSQNIKRLPEMRRLGDLLGVEIGTTIFTPVGRGKKYLTLRPSNKDLIRFFLEEVSSLNCDNSIADDTSLDINAGLTCGAGTLMVSIDCFGNVFPCHLFHQPQYKFGNLLEKPDLLEMIRSSKTAHQFRDRNVEKRKCHGCKVEYFCKGGCLARTVAAHNMADSWIERDPFCEVNKSVLSAQIWPNNHD